jgi:clan AA aspartic protease (TIGR02281 family)
MKRLITCCLLGLLSSLPALRLNAAEVALVEDHGIYKIPVRINDVLTLDFVIDSGASEVQVPADVALTLLRTGTITQDDFLPGKTYVLADGSNVKSERFILKHLKVGNVLVNQVEAGITGIEGQLLLGQSFLQKIDSWSLDNKRKLLILNEGGQDNNRKPAQITQPENKIDSHEASSYQGDIQLLLTSDDVFAIESDWGSNIRARFRKTECPIKEFREQGYLYQFTTDVPESQTKGLKDTYNVSRGRAVTQLGCWFIKKGTLTHVKMRRKKDGRIWEKDLDTAGGGWIISKQKW